MKTLFTLVIFSILFSFGCGRSGPSADSAPVKAESLRIRVDGRVLSIDPSYATFTTFKRGLILKESDITNKPGRRSGVVHRIYLANYDLELTDSRNQDFRRIDSEGQVRIEIQIEAEEGSTPEATPRGQYEHKSEPYGRISWVSVSYMKNGRDRSENLQAKDFAGKIKILSATNDEIQGEIDVFDREKYVKGAFKAKRLNKENL